MSTVALLLNTVVASDARACFQKSTLGQARRMMMAKLKVFDATSEEDSCSGFEESEISSQIKAMVRNVPEKI